MWPALLIVGVGEQKKVPLPFPLFLFWPFILIGWVVVGVISLFKRITWNDSSLVILSSIDSQSGKRRVPQVPLRMALSAFTKLHGLRIDIRSKGKYNFYILII
jgi:hypothetical protein